MVKRIKIGDHYFDMPGEDTTANWTSANGESTIKAEKSDYPEALEERQYIYRPNDPFQSNIDSVHALGSVGKTDKPWIRNAVLIMFVICPGLYFALFAVAQIMHNPRIDLWQLLIQTFATVLVFCGPFFIIWRRAQKKSLRNKTNGHETERSTDQIS